MINCLYVYTFYVVYPNQNLNTLSQKTVANNQHKIDVFVHLTEVAGEGGIDWASQKILSSQQFRHLMRCKKHVNKICLPNLVPEIHLFVYIFGPNSKWPPEVQKGSPVKFFEVSYHQNLNTYLDLNQQTASLEKKTIV